MWHCLTLLTEKENKKVNPCRGRPENELRSLSSPTIGFTFFLRLACPTRHRNRLSSFKKARLTTRIQFSKVEHCRFFWWGWWLTSWCGVGRCGGRQKSVYENLLSGIKRLRSRIWKWFYACERTSVSKTRLVGCADFRRQNVSWFWKNRD